jgi:hypothetical protein
MGLELGCTVASGLQLSPVGKCVTRGTNGSGFSLGPRQMGLLSGPQTNRSGAKSSKGQAASGTRVEGLPFQNGPPWSYASPRFHSLHFNPETPSPKAHSLWVLDRFLFCLWTELGTFYSAILMMSPRICFKSEYFLVSIMWNKDFFKINNWSQVIPAIQETETWGLWFEASPGKS